MGSDEFPPQKKVFARSNPVSMVQVLLCSPLFPTLQVRDMTSEEPFPARITTLFHEALHFLRPCTRSDEQGIRHVDDNQTIDTETSNEAS